jgi:hypothetical protein
VVDFAGCAARDHMRGLQALANIQHTRVILPGLAHLPFRRHYPVGHLKPYFCSLLTRQRDSLAYRGLSMYRSVFRLRAMAHFL